MTNCGCYIGSVCDRMIHSTVGMELITMSRVGKGTGRFCSCRVSM